MFGDGVGHGRAGRGSHCVFGPLGGLSPRSADLVGYLIVLSVGFFDVLYAIGSDFFLVRRVGSGPVTRGQARNLSGKPVGYENFPDNQEEGYPDRDRADPEGDPRSSGGDLHRAHTGPEWIE